MVHPTVQVAGPRVSQWGEGPIWWDNTLLYVDIEGHDLVRLDPATGEETAWTVGERIGTVVPRASGGVVYAGDNGIIAFDPASGTKQTLADPEPDKRPDNRFNDGKCDPAGRFWAGTISLVKKTGDASLYMLDLDGQLQTKLPEVTNSNGLCWNAARTVMYYIDTPTKQVSAFDYDDTTGAISHRRTVVDTGALGLEGSPDGMTIDAEDKIWVAFCHGGSVRRFDPESGEVLVKVDVPAVETTACAFGGPNLERLFVTTGIKKGADEPDGGKVFVIDGLGVQGAPAFAFQG